MLINLKLQNLIEQYINAYNTFNIDGMTEILDKDIHFRNISKGEVTTEVKGITKFLTLAEQSVQIFSQRRQVMKKIMFTGDRAEIDIDYERTLSIDLPNGMKAGETIKLQGKSIFQMKGEKLVLIEDRS